MKIHLEVHLTTMTAVGPSKSMRSGGFYVNDRDYKKDWEFTAAVEAYKFIETIKKEGGYDVTIDKVILDNKHDITHVVKQIRPIVDDSSLPFLSPSFEGYLFCRKENEKFTLCSYVFVFT